MPGNVNIKHNPNNGFIFLVFSLGFVVLFHFIYYYYFLSLSYLRPLFKHCRAFEKYLNVGGDGDSILHIQIPFSSVAQISAHTTIRHLRGPLFVLCCDAEFLVSFRLALHRIVSFHLVFSSLPLHIASHWNSEKFAEQIFRLVAFSIKWKRKKVNKYTKHIKCVLRQETKWACNISGPVWNTPMLHAVSFIQSFLFLLTYSLLRPIFVPFCLWLQDPFRCSFS